MKRDGGAYNNQCRGRNVSIKLPATTSVEAKEGNLCLCETECCDKLAKECRTAFFISACHVPRAL